MLVVLAEQMYKHMDPQIHRHMLLVAVAVQLLGESLLVLLQQVVAVLVEQIQVLENKVEMVQEVLL